MTTRHALALSLAGASLLLSGCINIATNLGLEDQTVAAKVKGEDCSTIFLGLGMGHNTVEQAMTKNLKTYDPASSSNWHMTKTPVKRIRVARLREGQFLLFGMRCVEVIGEP